VYYILCGGYFLLDQKPINLKIDEEVDPNAARLSQEIIELYKEFPIESVRQGSDDGGKFVEIFCKENKAQELRYTCGHWHKNMRTIIIGC
jgi:hypothetical protein